MSRALLPLLLFVAACSSNNDSSSSSNSSPGSSTSSTEETPKCGDATCDAAKEYCSFEASSDAQGNVSWAPKKCVAYPSKCSAPGPDDLTPSKTCDCISKATGSCPESGCVSTCRQANALVGFGAVPY